MSQEEGVRFVFKNILSENIFFATEYQENTTIKYAYRNLKVWVGTIYARITGTSSLSDL